MLAHWFRKAEGRKNSQHVQYQVREKKEYVCMCSVSVPVQLCHCLHALAAQHANTVLQMCNQGTLTASSNLLWCPAVVGQGLNMYFCYSINVIYKKITRL